MIDPTPNEKAALANAAQMGGEYLDSLGRTDLATLSTDQWECFIEAVVTGFCDHLRELAARDRTRLDAMTAEVRNAPPMLLDDLQLIALGGGRQIGNLAGKMSGSNSAADATVVPMTPEARACFASLSAEMTEELRAAAGTPFTAILARIGENAMKIALIVAVGREPVQPIIGREDAEWAIGFVRHFAKRTMDAVERHVADSETEAHLKRVREIIRAAGKNGLTKSEITRASQWLKARDRNDILETLVESGDIKPVMRGSATKQAMAFLLVR